MFPSTFPAPSEAVVVVAVGFSRLSLADTPGGHTPLRNSLIDSRDRADLCLANFSIAEQDLSYSRQAKARDQTDADDPSLPG